jgi:hypothetical protein
MESIQILAFTMWDYPKREWWDYPKRECFLMKFVQKIKLRDEGTNIYFHSR